jgi:hypothetical protein
LHLNLLLEGVDEVKDLPSPLPKVLLITDVGRGCLLSQNTGKVILAFFMVAIARISFAQFEVDAQLFLDFSLH